MVTSSSDESTRQLEVSNHGSLRPTSSSPTQASSAQGIELFEDLLWDLASLSFATRVFEPSLTFFPRDTGEDDRVREEQARTKADADETSESSVSAVLVSFATCALRPSSGSGKGWGALRPGTVNKERTRSSFRCPLCRDPAEFGLVACTPVTFHFSLQTKVKKPPLPKENSRVIRPCTRLIQWTKQILPLSHAFTFMHSLSVFTRLTFTMATPKSRVDDLHMNTRNMLRLPHKGCRRRCTRWLFHTSALP